MFESLKREILVVFPEIAGYIALSVPIVLAKSIGI
jgi:hypothetical protein